MSRKRAEDADHDFSLRESGGVVRVESGLPVGADEVAERGGCGPGRGSGEAMEPRTTLADADAVRGELRTEGVGHEGVVGTGAEAEGLPAARWDGDDGTLAMGYIHAEGEEFGVAVGMEDVVVDGAAFDEDVGVSGNELVEVVDGVVVGEHVVVLALDCEGAAVDDDLLGRDTDDAEVAGFSGE